MWITHWPRTIEQRMRREERLHEYLDYSSGQATDSEQWKIKQIEYDLTLLEGMNELLLKSLE